MANNLRRFPYLCEVRHTRLSSALVLRLLWAASAHAQLKVATPLPHGILQVHGDHADLHFKATVPAAYLAFRIKLSSDRDTSSPFVGYTPVSDNGGKVDTLLTVEKSLRAYTLYWQADSAGVLVMGNIPGLTPGHIIGIAGQSNAAGESWDPGAEVDGDIRMLHSDVAWEPAKEPTANDAAGPWLVMADSLYKLIGDTLPIGLVNVAVGGSGIMFKGDGGRWFRNDSNPVDSSIYGHALHRFRDAGGELECLCWIQGETEAAYFPYLFDPARYQDTFKNLMSELRADLGDAFPIFHLQVGGWTGTHAPSFPEVHQAQLNLPPSTLAGTAIGLPVQSDGVHYTREAYYTVGRIFAGAILKELHATPARMYPPLVPDTVAHFDSILDGTIKGRYCVSLRFTRGGGPAKLRIVSSSQYFSLVKDGVPLDTANVWFVIPPDSQRVLVGLRSDSIDLKQTWQITYDATSEADRAPLATIDVATRDTLFAAGCFFVPVTMAPEARLDVRKQTDFSIEPIASSTGISCVIIGARHETLHMRLCDNRGATVFQSDVAIEAGRQQIDLPTGPLASGTYWIVLRDDAGGELVKKEIVLH